ncbi:endoplasmic reticulum-Golgi intermediate compartment protein 3-like [Ascaphus truei]|uniref:endoplasmic reticulum-Golgi intermediate compartment protein 3-like n=1 Tax=Ascaphus truei TaxID=8439 RepID=UPI003F5AC00A
MEALHQLKQFDAYPKTLDDFRVKTCGGAVVHDLQSFGLDNINMTHHIKHLSFGRDYPGIVNPLDGTSVDASQASMMFQYFVKIFPTVYVKVDGEV